MQEGEEILGFRNFGSLGVYERSQMAVRMSNEGFRKVCGVNNGLMKGATSQVMGLLLCKRERRSEIQEG